MGNWKTIIKRPGQVIAQAKRTGLVALLYILKRGDEEFPGVYQRSLKLWREAWAESQKRKHIADFDYFIPICNVEKYLRKNQHSMIFNTTAPFGNTETKRVYSWDEGPIGPMNSLLNIGGARIRFLAMTRYPFPTPIKLQYEYKLKNGSIKLETGYGYRGSQRSTKVILAHPLLPALDFVDMIRAPVNELCRQCFIYSVPSNVATNYINLLIFKLRPFLDHIYTRKRTGNGTKVGTDGYVEKLDDILNQILVRIRAYYSKKNGRPLRITQRISDEEWSGKSTLTLQDILPKDVTCQVFKNLEKKIGKEIDKRDFRRLAEDVLNQAAVIGTRAHKRISWGLVSPSTDRTIVMGGDYYAENKSGYLLAADVPVWSGLGKADFVLYVRRSISVSLEGEEQAPGIWQPVMVVDLKSKTSFDCGFVGRQNEGSPNIVVSEITRKRNPTIEEWQQAIQNTPSISESRQLDLYSKGLIVDYQRMNGDESNGDLRILQGILLVDDSEFPSTIRKHLEKFLISAYERVRSDLSSKSASAKSGTKKKSLLHPRSVLKIQGDSTRLALVLKPFSVKFEENVAASFPLPSVQSELHSDSPYNNCIPDSREFILYVTGGGTGPGEIASWIARYWHGIEYTYQEANQKGYESVLWFDFAGEFSDSKLRRAFIWRYAQNESALKNDKRKSKREHIQKKRLYEFLRKTKFVDLSEKIETALFGGGEFPSIDYLKSLTSGYDIFIVSGMDTLWDMTPPEVKGLLQTLAVNIAESTAISSTTIIWFESGIPTPDVSETYKQHRFSPFSYDSPLQVYIDRIIINHPVPPAYGISESPFVDEIRRIVRLTPQSLEELGNIEIPSLRNWSSRFRSETFPDKKKPQVYHKGGGGTIGITPSTQDILSQFDTNQFLDIISLPILRAYNRLPYNPDDNTVSSRLTLDKNELKDKDRTRGYKGVLSRITLTENLSDPQVHKVVSKRENVTFKPIKRVNKRRKNWSSKLHYKPEETTPLPPYESTLTLQSISIKSADKLEIDRILAATALLRKRRGFPNAEGFLKDLMMQFAKLLETSSSDASLCLGIYEFLDDDSYSQSILKRLEYHRSDIFGWNPSPGIRKALESMKQKDRAYFSRYGNYLIILLSALQKRWGYFGFDQLQILWDSVRPWVVLQLGANQRKNAKPVSQFNMEGVFDSLMFMAKHMKQIPEMQIPSFDEIRYGIMIDSMDLDSDSGPAYRWYVFEKTPYSNDFIAGCTQVTLQTESRHTIIPLDKQAESAERCSSIWHVIPILIGRVNNLNILYAPLAEGGFPYQSADEIDYRTPDWTAVGQLRYATRKAGALARLKWIGTSWYALFPTPSGISLPRRASDIAERMQDYLNKITTNLSDVAHAECEISGTKDKGSICFRLKDEQNVGKIEYKDNDAAVKILRTPYDDGIPLVLGDNLLTWNPVKDITYSSGTKSIKIQVDKGLS